MTTTFELQIKGNKAWLELLYQEGFLTRATVFNDGSLSDVQRQFIWGSLLSKCRDEDYMKKYIAMHTDKFKVQPLIIDTNFDTFWTMYANKVGKKERTQQLWKLLPDEDKHRALTGIKKYKNWLLQNPSVQMLYPETYISQKRWENEY